MILFLVPKRKIEIFPRENLTVLGKYKTELFLFILISKVFSDLYSFESKKKISFNPLLK